jgi:hypothetical protein
MSMWCMDNSYLSSHMRLTCSGLIFVYRSFPFIFRSYLPVFVLPFIPLPFSLPAIRLPLPFSSKNIKMKTVERFSVRFRPFSTILGSMRRGTRAPPWSWAASALVPAEMKWIQHEPVPVADLRAVFFERKLRAQLAPVLAERVWSMRVHSDSFDPLPIWHEPEPCPCMGANDSNLCLICSRVVALLVIAFPVQCKL